MKIAVFSTKSYDRKHMEEMNQKYNFEIDFYSFKLSRRTVKMAEGCDAVCIFVNDDCDREVLEKLAALKVKMVALRCAGFNNVDIEAAQELGIKVVRVPAYSPEAVAEHTVALMMALNRNIPRAYQRTRDANFSLEGLIGFNMHGRTAGVVGTGRIGVAVIRILKGFGMNILAFDPFKNPAAEELGVKYVTLDELYAQSDVITLHCPATPENYHLINDESLSKMKDGVMLINTSRGALIDTRAILNGIKSRKIGSVGLDVYENEQEFFFEDKSNDIIQDDLFRRVSIFHNVILTGHQAFLTAEALVNISDVTLGNINTLATGEDCPNLVLPA